MKEGWKVPSMGHRKVPSMRLDGRLEVEGSLEDLIDGNKTRWATGRSIDGELLKVAENEVGQILFIQSQKNE